MCTSMTNCRKLKFNGNIYFKNTYKKQNRWNQIDDPVKIGIL